MRMDFGVTNKLWEYGINSHTSAMAEKNVDGSFVEIAVAKAEADRQANDARINAEREIAKKNNELSLQKSELKKLEDTKKAEADAAYSIQEQEQRKTIEVATAEASIAKQEKEVTLKEREAQVRE